MAKCARLWENGGRGGWAQGCQGDRSGDDSGSRSDLLWRRWQMAERIQGMARASTLKPPRVCAHYKYATKKTKLVRYDVSMTYDFPQRNEAGMLLKNKGACKTPAKLVSLALTTIYQLRQKPMLRRRGWRFHRALCDVFGCRKPHVGAALLSRTETTAGIAPQTRRSLRQPAWVAAFRG